jgi:AcrR family transcriptional regulator
MLYRERIDILQATLKPISEYGFHNTPMSKTTTEANVGAGTIYRYFENKKALIKAVIVTDPTAASVMKQRGNWLKKRPQ